MHERLRGGRRVHALVRLRSDAPHPRAALVQPLAPLDFKWEDGVHDGRPAVHVDDLTCNEAGLLHAQERHGVADVFRGSKPSHRRPPALVPGSRGLLDVLRQSAQNTTLDYVGGPKTPPGLMPLTVIRRGAKATA